MIHPGMTVHDLHLVREGEEEYLAFDAVLPQDCRLSEQEAKERLGQLVTVLCGKEYRARIKIDHG